jgi:predicted amidohydrolase YtcJ
MEVRMNGKESDCADLIVSNARVTTLQSDCPQAEALATRGERVVAVGSDADLMQLRGRDTRAVDAGGRRVIPGLNDSHLHAIRAGVQYNLDLRWDGVQSLQRGLDMICDQARSTPSGQWVRVMGRWSPFQFERRMPTIEELNAVAPSTPVLILFAYSEVLLNKAGVAALAFTSGNLPFDGRCV